MVELVESGEFGTTDYKMSFKKGGSPYSPWHDAPLQLEGGLYNMLTEIPKMTLKKMEVTPSSVIQILFPPLHDLSNNSLNLAHLELWRGSPLIYY